MVPPQPLLAMRSRAFEDVPQLLKVGLVDTSADEVAVAQFPFIGEMPSQIDAIHVG
jgi:hypothetical protein